MLLCQHCGIFPKMHIASIQIGDVFIGVHRKLHERRVFGRAFWPWPPRLHGWSSWLVKLLFFGCTLAGKHISSQATTQYSPSQYGCHAEEPIEGLRSSTIHLDWSQYPKASLSPCSTQLWLSGMPVRENRATILDCNSFWSFDSKKAKLATR